MRKLVVAAAIVRGGRVLAARRSGPPELAGRWELPGGKCEPGEPPHETLEREITEELGCEIDVTGWLAGVTEIGETHELRAAFARLRRGEPNPTEHDQVRWLGRDELDEVDWLEPDRPFLAEIRSTLEQAPSTRRIIVFDQDDAEALEQRLRHDGFEAEVWRERLHGEDDDEDHPWAVLTDAPAFVAEVLTDEYDGWLDEDQEQDVMTQGSPLDLPTAPRRLTRNP